MTGFFCWVYFRHKHLRDHVLHSCEERAVFLQNCVKRICFAGLALICVAEEGRNGG